MNDLLRADSVLTDQEVQGRRECNNSVAQLRTQEHGSGGKTKLLSLSPEHYTHDQLLFCQIDKLRDVWRISDIQAPRTSRGVCEPKPLSHGIHVEMPMKLDKKVRRRAC